jgi:isochorismate synthase
VSGGLDVARPRVTTRPPSAQELARFLAEALARPAREGQLRAFVLPLPAPLSAPGLLRSLRGVDAWYLKSARAGTELLGLGATERVAPTGEGRFAEVQRAIRHWMSTLSVTAHPDAPRLPIRCFTGFAFAPGAARGEPWEPFGDALAVLPRWTIVQPTGERGALLLTLGPGGATELVLAELQEILASPRPLPSEQVPSLDVVHEPRERYEARVEAALGDITRGDLAKVVVSRRSVITSEADLDPIRALEGLDASGAASTVYLVRRAGSVLLGVTPERLLSIRGAALETEALAGTAREAGTLSRSEKDRAEHQFVIDSIRSALGPLASEISVAESPEISLAGAMHHLRTRITATLASGTHPLEVAAALHPTSAVAGTPKREATEWIARAEPGRGWYTGLVGWVDQHDGAELAVALRGGVIRGARAWAFSGGGIVRGSVPAAEHDETTLKMSGFLRALGLPG